MLLLVGAKRSEPHLAFGEPFPQDQQLFIAFSPVHGGSTAGSVSAIGVSGVPGPAVKSSRNATFVYVLVLNEKRAGRQAATEVFATITFAKPNGESFEMSGRWADPPESQFLQPTIRAPEVASIPANGNPHILDVARKYLDDPYCYAFNDENRTHSLDLRYQPIQNDETVVTVEISSNARPLVGQFVLSHKGKGTTVSLERRLVSRKTLGHPFKGVMKPC